VKVNRGVEALPVPPDEMDEMVVTVKQDVLAVKAKLATEARLDL